MDVFIMVGAIFSIVGGTFTVIGGFMWVNLEALINSPNSSGDVRILPVIFSGIGILFLVIGVALLANGIKNRKKQKALVDNGYYLMAKVIDVYRDMAVKVNGRHPFKVVCSYDDPYSDKKYVFKSNDTLKPAMDLMDREIKVYVDRENYAHYYVDVESELKNVIEL